MKYYVFHEKHAPVYVSSDTVEKIMAYILHERLEDGYWYIDGDEDTARVALENDKALLFMYSRRRYEYEGFDEIIFHNV